MEPRDTSRAGLQIGLWAQYVLDNAATVTDALDELDKVQFVMATGSVNACLKKKRNSSRSPVK
ncbi:hypothetical protein L9H26_14565 [Morganella psychrotolerans]|uniref:hypothetical protein n=1 Tax=Morganella psychrotolerans TaxID=368603 RepID=UPI001F276521|nr:hypothetical protein [Morganella psychrotolerans]